LKNSCKWANGQNPFAYLFDIIYFL